MNHGSSSGTSYADVLRKSREPPVVGGGQGCDGGSTKSRIVSLSIKFLDSEKEWRKLQNRLEVAKAWIYSCAHEIGEEKREESDLSCCEGDYSLVVKLGGVVEKSMAGAKRGDNDEQRSSEHPDPGRISNSN